MLNKELLKQEIKQAFLDEQTEEQDANASVDRLSEKLANAFDKFVRNGKVEIEAGISVSTTGTSTAQMGSTTSIGIGKVK